MDECSTRDRPALRGRTRRKRGGQIPFGNAAVRAIDRVERQAEQGAPPTHDGIRQHPHDRNEHANDGVFEPVLHRARLVGRLFRRDRAGSHLMKNGLLRKRYSSTARQSRRRVSSQSQKRSGGSIPTTSGTAAIGSSPRSHAVKRTASFSVVNTIEAAA